MILCFRLGGFGEGRYGGGCDIFFALLLLKDPAAFGCSFLCSFYPFLFCFLCYFMFYSDTFI